MHIRIALIASAAALLLVQGCATSYVPLRPYTVAPIANPVRPAVSVAAAAGTAVAATPTPGASMAGATAPESALIGLSIGELLQMLQARRPQRDIAADLQTRGLRVAPAPADFDVLAAAGASPELLQVLGATPAQAEAHIANGGVGAASASTSQTTVVVQPNSFYDVVYPWVPFSFGLGFGHYAGSAHHWGYVPYRAYPPLRIGGWGHSHIPRAIHPHAHPHNHPHAHPHAHPGRGAPRGPGFRLSR